MRRSVLVLLLLAACDREVDYQYLCKKYADENLGARNSDAWVNACVKGRWSPKQMDCHARAGTGSFQAMFCDD